MKHVVVVVAMLVMVRVATDTGQHPQQVCWAWLKPDSSVTRAVKINSSMLGCHGYDFFFV